MDKKEVVFGWYVLLLAVVLLTFFSIKQLASPTALVVYEEKIMINTWNFSNPQEYQFNNTLLNISAGEVKLSPTTNTTTWTLINSSLISLSKALLNPSDKTDKIDQLDNKHLEKNENELVDIFFSSALNNNDIISLYIIGGSSGNIYLCAKGISCTGNYGSAYYEENNGGMWYNLTINNLPSSAHVFSLSGTKIKIDYVTSSAADVNKALYNSQDKTEKVSTIDDQKLELEANDQLDLLFENELSENDIISFYVEAENQNPMYLCLYGEDCLQPGLGIIETADVGWRNISLQNFSIPTNGFRIKGEEMHINAIEAYSLHAEEHTITSVVYPASASFETKTFSPPGWIRWNNFTSTTDNNSQNVSYFYSSDEGLSWNPLPQDVQEINNSIRFMVTLHSNGTTTPIVHNFSLSYTVSSCLENWNLHYGECLKNNSQLLYYYDSNLCGTTILLPENNGTFVQCDYCEGQNCTSAFLIAEKIEENDTSSRWKIDAVNATKTLLEIITDNSSHTPSVSIVAYTQDIKESTLPALSVSHYVDLEASEANISSIKIFFYYTDEEIAASNIHEETLRIHYFNETSQTWEELPSTVNTSENYLYTIVPHLSYYGLFGREETKNLNAVSSESAGGGSESSTGASVTSIDDTEQVQSTQGTLSVQTSADSSTVEITSAEQQCTYVVEIALPSEISLEEQEIYEGELVNRGNCTVPSLSLGLSDDLKTKIELDSETITDLQPGDDNNFILIRKENKEKKIFSYVTASAITDLKQGEIVEGFFIVQAEDPQNAFKKELPVKIILRKPFHITSWVYLTSGVLAITISSLIIYFIRRKKNLSGRRILPLRQFKD